MWQSSALQPWLALLVSALTACAAPEGRGEHDPNEPLRVLLPRDVQEIDPRFTGDAYGLRVSRLLFASLVTIDPHTLEVENDLAEQIDVVDGLEYRVRLRPGLRFSDGSALDAADVKATFESVRSPTLGSRYAQAYARVISIQTPSSLDVVFTLDGPHATFITDLEMPVLRAEEADARVDGLDAKVIGSGPYVLAERARGRLELAPNSHWHRGTPKHPHLSLRVVRDDNTRALRMLASAADLTIGALPPLLIPLFDHDRSFTVTSARGIGTTYLGANTGRGPVSSKLVRQALSMLVDRDSLIAHKLGGRAVAARGWIPPGHWAYAHDVLAPVFDLHRAASLLDEAGYPLRNGMRMSLVLRCGSDRSRLSMAHAIAAMLRRGGVQVEVRPTEVATLLSDLQRGHFDIALLEVPEVIEPHVLTWFFATNRIPVGDRLEGANRWRFANPELDAELERGRRDSRRGERVEAYRRAQQILADELPVIPLWHEDVVAVAGPRAHDVATPRDGRLRTLAW